MKNITMYVGGYLAKAQGKNFNMSAIMAKGYAYHLHHLQNVDVEYTDHIQHEQRLLLFCLINSVNHKQELAAPMVISYLMEWGDCFCSHHYSPIYYTSFIYVLLLQFPMLKQYLYFCWFIVMDTVS